MVVVAGMNMSKLLEAILLLHLHQQMHAHLWFQILFLQVIVLELHWAELFQSQTIQWRYLLHLDPSFLLLHLPGLKNLGCMIP